MLYLTATTTYTPHTFLYRTTITTPARIVTLYAPDRATSLTSALRALGLPEYL